MTRRHRCGKGKIVKLPRPYIPLSVRVQVAERQCRERGISPLAPVVGGSLGARLHFAFIALSHVGLHNPELHHRPALCNRARDEDGNYDPPANNPEYLVYLPADEHDIETRVRGIGAQRSDLGQKRYLKRVAKNRESNNRKYNWPKRKLRSRPFSANAKRR
jgi:hypothetical protein